MSLFRGIAYIILGDQAFTGYPDELRLLRPGLCLVGDLVRARALRARGARLLRPAAPHQLRPHASMPSATTRSPRCSPASASTRVQLHAVPADRPDVRPRRRLPDLAPRLDPPVDRHGLGARGRHHGRARRRQHPRRLGHHPRRGARRLHHGPRHLRLRPAQRAGHRHVDLPRPTADRGHRPAPPLGAGAGQGEGADAEIRLQDAAQSRDGGRVPPPPRRDLARAGDAAEGGRGLATIRSISTRETNIALRRALAHATITAWTICPPIR